MRFSQVSWFMNNVVGPVKKKRQNAQNSSDKHVIHAFFTSWLVHKQCCGTIKKVGKTRKTPQANAR